VAAHNDARPSPGLISKSNFDDICERHRIRVDKRKLLRDMVDGATSAIAKSMKEERLRPKRREDRLRIKKAIGALALKTTPRF
jgi:hypothetical protein